MADDLIPLVRDIQNKAAACGTENPTQREDLLRSARNLVAALESPADRVVRTANLPLVTAACRLLVDTKTYHALVACAPTPQTSLQLAATTGTDAVLLTRLLKTVAFEHHVEEVSPDTYRANATTHLLASPGGASTIVNLYVNMDVCNVMPKYFKERRYTNPTERSESAFHYVHGKNYWDWVSEPENAEELAHFNNHMSFKTTGNKWFTNPDLISYLFDSTAMNSNPNNQSDRPILLVDIGGASGHDLLAFHAHHPTIHQTGRFILQDLPSTISTLPSTTLQALSSASIEPLAHDMFTWQPLRGARAYYLKMVLHDWPDASCAAVLERLRDAMVVGWSRILINEMVVEDVGAGWFETTLDLLMMGVHSGRERREGDWRALVEGVKGLKVRRIWKVEGAVERVVEVERVE